MKAMLCIGTKYQINHLREDAILRLKDWLPLERDQFFQQERHGQRRGMFCAEHQADSGLEKGDRLIRSARSVKRAINGPSVSPTKPG